MGDSCRTTRIVLLLALVVWGSGPLVQGWASSAGPSPASLATSDGSVQRRASLPSTPPPGQLGQVKGVQTTTAATIDAEEPAKNDIGGGGKSTTTTTTTTATTVDDAPTPTVAPEAELSTQLDASGQRSGGDGDGVEHLNGTTPAATPTTPPPTIAKRRMTNRDNKLMSVLQARRTALSRDRPWRGKESHHHTPPSVSLRASLQRQQASGVAGNLVEDSSTPESNLILPVPAGVGPAGGDEFLDTDESIHGMYVVNPRTGKIALQQTGAGIKLAKETNNFIGVVPPPGNKSLESITKLTSTKVPTTTTTTTTTSGTSGYTPPTPSGRGLYLETRGKRLRDRKTFVPLSTERSVEESDLIPYQFFGQKLLPAHHKGLDARNQVVNVRHRTHLSKLKEDPATMAEMGELLLLPKPSTEKSKFWSNRYPSRNGVALGSYLRRGMTTTTTTSTTTTGAPVHSADQLLTNSMIALSNLPDVDGGEDDEQKLVFSRSASMPNKTEEIERGPPEQMNVPTESETLRIPTTELPSNHRPEQPNEEYLGPAGGRYGTGLAAGISKLIINYPDDATPEELYRPLNTFETHAQIVHMQEATEEPALEPTTEQPEEDEFETPRTLVSLPDINQIFRNLSTPTTTQMTTTTTRRVPVTSTMASLPARSRLNTRVYVPVSRSTTTRSTMTTTTTTTEQPEKVDVDPPTTTVLVLTSNPTTTETRPPPTTTTTMRTTPESPSTTPLQPLRTSTVRTFRPSAPPTVVARPSTTIPTTAPTSTPSPPERRTVVVFTGLRPSPPEQTNAEDDDGEETGFNPILSHIFPKLTGPGRVDPSLAFTSPPPVDHSSGTKKPTVSFDGVLLHHNSDVVIEMRKMNTATFVLAGLGMLPIVIIVLYVLKATVFGREHKVSHDLERYIPDGQPPISPVVRLEQSDTSSGTDESSIMTEHDFNRGNLRFKSLLGEGNFGQVWKAEADDLAGHLGTTRIVAVKTERSDNGHGDLKAEAEIMRKLGSHPNVVTLLGACLEQDPQLLIMEYAMRGRLLSLLRAARGAVNGLAPSVHNNRPPIMPLSPRRLAGFAHDIARGMEYIAEKKIVHRDLAARNVLLDHNGICKICDFGMSIDLEKVKSSHAQVRLPRAPHPPPTESRFKFDLSARSFGIGRHHHGHGHDGAGGTRHGAGMGGDGSHGHDTKSRPALPIRWMAPEALQYHIFSRETDVWAFGIVLWEIATLGCTPYPNLSGREVVRSVPNGARPEVPADCRPELYELMQRTWRKDPRQRPTFTEARACLARTLCQWQLEDNDTSNTSEYLDVSGFSEDLEQGMVYFNRRISEFECEI